MKKLMAVMLLGLSFGVGAETLLSLEKTRSPNFTVSTIYSAKDKTYITSHFSTDAVYSSSCTLDSSGIVTLVSKFKNLSTLTKKVSYKIDVVGIKKLITESMTPPTTTEPFHMPDIPGLVIPKEVYVREDEKNPGLVITLKAYQNGKAIRYNPQSSVPDAIYYYNGLSAHPSKDYPTGRGDLGYVIDDFYAGYHSSDFQQLLEEICK